MSKSVRNSIPAHPCDVYPYSLQRPETANPELTYIKRHSRICDRFRNHLRLSSRACEDVCPWHSCHSHILPCLPTLGDLVTRIGGRSCNELVTLGSGGKTEYIALSYAEPRSHTSCIPLLTRFICPLPIIYPFTNVSRLSCLTYKLCFKYKARTYLRMSLRSTLPFYRLEIRERVIDPTSVKRHVTRSLLLHFA